MISLITWIPPEIYTKLHRAGFKARNMDIDSGLWELQSLDSLLGIVHSSSEFLILDFDFIILYSGFWILDLWFILNFFYYGFWIPGPGLIHYSKILILASEFLILVCEFLILVSEFLILDSEFLILVSEFWIPDSGLCIPDTEFLIFGFWIPDSGFWILYSDFWIMNSWFWFLNSLVGLLMNSWFWFLNSGSWVLNSFFFCNSIVLDSGILNWISVSWIYSFWFSFLHSKFKILHFEWYNHWVLNSLFLTQDSPF